MNEPVKSRLQQVREEAEQGKSVETILKTRLVVSIDKIVEDPENERKTFANMDDMVASVKANGIIEPPTVTPIDAGRYKIATGHRRFRAAKLAGLEQIEILIRAPEEGTQRRIKSLISNIQRENVPPLELAESIKALIDTGLKQEQVGEQIGKDKAWISAVLRLLDLPDEAKAAVVRAEFPVSMDSLTRIARLDDRPFQVELAEGLVTGELNQQDVRARIQQRKGGGEERSTAKPKSKKVFNTEQKAMVIVQAMTSKKLTSEQVIEALKEALVQARKT